MTNNFIRNPLYKDLDVEIQNMLFQIFEPHHMVEYFSCYLSTFIILLPYIILIIIALFKVSLTSISLVVRFIILIYYIGILIFFNLHKENSLSFSDLLCKKIYFHIYTKKGLVLTKKDLKRIRQNNKYLYELIKTQKCIGRCYLVCFYLCKILNKGSVEFVAIRDFSLSIDNTIENYYTMHTLYINNGWAFDTNSSRQFPIKELHDIYKSKVYKTYSFCDINGLSYEDFMLKENDELTTWAKTNDCSIYN